MLAVYSNKNITAIKRIQHKEREREREKKRDRAFKNNTQVISRDLNTCKSNKCSVFVEHSIALYPYLYK